MDFTIHTFGGGEIIWKILNGIAIFLKNDSEYFTPVLKLSVGVGGVWAALTAIYKHQVGIFARDWFVPAFLALNILFVPKTTVNIIDHVDDSHHASQVAGVPMGLAIVSSAPSQLFYHISVLFEKVMVPGGTRDVMKYTKTGPMFAAQLINASREVRISDPILLQNMKAFVKQCYQWPYVVTNITPGTKAAVNAPSILDFIEDNPHPALGIYWQGNKGETTFRICHECVPEVKRHLQEMEMDGLLQLTQKLDRNIDESQLQIYLKDAWDEIAKGSTTAHEIVGQQMMINANKEAWDDSREFHGLTRYNPRMTSYSATRAWEGQNQGFLINGILAARHLPTIQNVVFGMLILMFIFVLPMAFFPGGMGILGTWVKMVFWVTSWPVFFTIINIISNMWLTKATGFNNLSFATQNGLADHAFNAYTMMQGMSWMVPMLAWAFMNRGGYALVQGISGLTANLGQSQGQQIADNTQTFDVQAFHNRNAESYSVGQQTYSPSFLSATRINDGNIDRMISTTGQETYQQQMTNMMDNISLTKSLSSSFTQNEADERSVAENLQVSSNTVNSQSVSHGSDFVNSWGKSDSLSEIFGEAENRDVRQSMEKAASFSKNMSESDSMSNASSNRLSGHVGAEFSGGPAKPIMELLGLKISAGGKAEFDTSAADQNTLSKAKEFGISEKDLENISKAMNAVHENKVSLSSESSQKAADSLRTSMDKSKSLQDQISAHQSKAQRYSEMAAATQNMGAGINSNINDDVLNYVAAMKFNNRKHDAMLWASKNREAFQQEGHRYIKGYLEHTESWLKDSGRNHIDPEMLEVTYNQFKEQTMMRGQPIQLMDDTAVKAERNKFGVGHGFGEEFQKAADNRRVTVLDVHKKDLPETEIARDHKALEGRFDYRKSRIKPMRVLKND